ncbi:TorD/DmsD family molecular chaperone [Photobacterium sanguinicancri]|uniref:TorD/DmsD family molecular chaperone n=1 Tax=Photobacterium sanguinicancri TaxID=875932 RepID=UPI0026E3880A|nr:molecular chaperone [Photobacterium sanguinicancri]MDO6499206.1 molecular chaperone [Photobacterium sanguinicancri]
MQNLTDTSTELSLDDVNTMSKIFGSLFYFPLNHENNKAIIELIKYSDDLEHNGFADFVCALTSEKKQALNDDFFLLFEGGEVMVAPPWGSVYLDKEQVVFGDSTVRLRQFLRANNIELNTGMREPEDQFGLMLFAISQLIEQSQAHQSQQNVPEVQQQVEALFTDHLLPWCIHYLSLVEKHSTTNTYQHLAVLVKEWCVAVQNAWQLTPLSLKVYR